MTDYFQRGTFSLSAGQPLIQRYVEHGSSHNEHLLSHLSDLACVCWNSAFVSVLKKCWQKKG